MPTVKKSKATTAQSSRAQAKAATSVRTAVTPRVDWSKGVVTRGGGVAATIATLGRTRGPGKKPAKEQVAIRLDQDIVGAFRADGPGWQTRMNAALKEWLASRPAKRKTRNRNVA